MLFFGKPLRSEIIVPSAKTASMPKSWWRIDPYRRNRRPPALVAIIPPMVAVVFRVKIDSKTKTVGLGGVGHTRKGDTRTDSDRRRVDIYRVDALQTLCAQENFVVQRHRPTDVTGISALRHNRNAFVVAPPQDRSDFLRSSGKHDSRSRSDETPCPVRVRTVLAHRRR